MERVIFIFARLVQRLLWRAEAGACLALLVFAALGGDVHAQQLRYEGITDPGFAWSKSWVDINTDGRDDYCVLAGAAGDRLECYLSDGTSFGNKQVFAVGGGTDPRSMRWSDADGDGQVDICRLSGGPGIYSNIPVTNDGRVTCWLGPAFVSSVTAPIPMRWTYANPEGGGAEYYGLSTWDHLHLTDVNADSRADICYVHVGAAQASELRCLLANGAGFDAPSSAWTRTAFDAGLNDYPRGFHDFNGDGYGDLCRVVMVSGGSYLRCTLSGPSGFLPGELTSSTVVVMPYKEGAAFVDMNADGKSDFCRFLGSTGSYYIACRLSNGIGWQTSDVASPTLDPGDAVKRWWVDINADGFPDYCRATGQMTDEIGTLSCRLGRGDGDGVTASTFVFSDVSVTNVDFGSSHGGRTFCDAAGTGIQTLCRATYRQQSSGEFCYEGENGPHCYATVANIWGVFAGITDATLQARHALLSSYSDGLGAETRITYLPMSSNDVYTRSAIVANPRALIAQPRSSIVHETRAWTTDSHALTGNARYFYKDLRNDTWSGFLGFRERWIFTEGSNTLDHVVFFQGLGPAVDASSVLNDRREIGLIKYQERFAVANGLIPAPSSIGLLSPRQGFVRQVVERARGVSAVPLGAPTTQSPFVLLQSTTNTLSDTTPANPRHRYVGSSLVKGWDWNGSSQVAIPEVLTATELSDLGNVKSIVQTTTAPNGQWWRKTTTNTYGQEDQNAWILGRLTKSVVKSEAPPISDQIAAHGSSVGGSAGAGDTSSSAPAVPQPLSPAVLSAILQLLLDD